jgi:hypothetical protein
LGVVEELVPLGLFCLVDGTVQQVARSSEIAGRLRGGQLSVIALGMVKGLA